MEQVIDIYERPYDSRRPAVCFDKRPGQLLNDLLMPLPMKPGCIKRRDYHYERNRASVVLLAVEPQAGDRIVKATRQKTKKDYACFMKSLASRYLDAEKIVLVSGSLNTCNPSSFYETFSAQEAFELSQRFEFVYTPKRAGRLNMAEIELPALSKQCLDRHIAQRDILAREVLRWSAKRSRIQTKITW